MNRFVFRQITFDGSRRMHYNGQISDFLIQKALKEINPEEYETTFDQLAIHHWKSIRESNLLKKKKKFCDYLLRKGWENDRVFEKAHEFEKTAPEL